MTKNALVSLPDLHNRRDAGTETWPACRLSATTLPQCTCGVEMIHAFRLYLREQFPGYTVRDFHERTRVTQVGFPAQYADHHVVSVTDWQMAYYAVLSSEMCGYPLSRIRERLSEWRLAEMLRAHGIVIVSSAGLSTL